MTRLFPSKTAVSTAVLLFLVSLSSPSRAPAQTFPNVARTPGELLAGPIAPEQGRTAIIAWHGERIVTVPESPGSQPGADVQMRVVNILDPENPQVTHLPVHAGGFHAHGYYQSGNYLFVGSHCMTPDLQPCGGGTSVWADSLRIGGAGTAIGDSQLRRASIESETGLLLGTWLKSGAQAPWGVIDYWSYNTFEGDAWLAVRRNNEWVYDWGNGGSTTGPAIKARWDHLGLTGVTGFPFIMGNILIWASDQAGTGVASYDISDITNPVLLDVLKDGGIGGYWPEIYGHYIFFPRRDGDGGAGSTAGFMVVDFSDPTDLKVVASRHLPGSNQYVNFQDEYAFMNNYKIDMRTFDVVLEFPIVEGVIDMSQFVLPVGNLAIGGGYGTLGPGLHIFAHQAEPDTRSPFVVYHVPTPDQTNYPLQLPITISIPETLRTETIVNGTSLIVRPVGGSAIPIWHAFSQSKLLTVTPQQPLLPDTTYEVVLTSAILDAMGNGLEPYTFRFSTGSGLSGGNQPPSVTSLTATPASVAPGQTMTFDWTGTDGDDDPIDYRFDVGDGTPRTEWGPDLTLDHVYTEAGHYQVTVQARDIQGSVSARTLKVTIVDPPTALGSTASSQIALNDAANRVYVVNPDIDTVTALEADSLTKLWEMPVGAHPLSVAIANENTLWVACRDEDAVDVLNAADGSLIERIELAHGAAPVASAPSPDGSLVFVTTEGDGTLRRYSVASLAQTGSLAVGSSPRAIAITHDGTRALVTRFLSGENYGEVYDVSLAGSMSLTRTIRMARDRSSDGPATSRGVPNYLAGIRISPSGEHAYVLAKKDNTNLGTYFHASLVPGQDTTVRALMMLIDLSTNAEDISLRLDIDNSDSPTAVDFSPLGDYAFVTLQGNAQVGIVDVLDLLKDDTPGTLQRRIPTGIAPQGVVMDATNNRALSADFLSRSVTALDVSDFLSTGSANVPTTTIPTVAEERLHPDVLLGKQIFYHASDPRMSAEGYISCATCHVGGAHDGRTWDFTNRGEGFRNTTDLRGRSGTRHGNVHWSSNFDEIQDFENDIRDFFGGTGFIEEDEYVSVIPPLGSTKAGLSEDLDALAAYVTSLGSKSLPRSPYREANGGMSEAATRGLAVFTANNCQSCHVPETDFTDGLSHNVGTLRDSSGNRLGGALTEIKTPSLLGVHAGAPYFHDGSASTLEEVFISTGGRLSQAEGATLLGGAYIDTVNWITLKEWHQGGFVEVDNARQISFADVYTSVAGAGYLEVRYNQTYWTSTIGATINGGATSSVFLQQTGNDPNWYPNEWRKVRIPVTFAAGNNTVVVSESVNGGQLLIDDVLFSTPDDQVLAQAHFRNLGAGDTADLVAYLRSLDGAAAAAPEVAIERDAPLTIGGTDHVSTDMGIEQVLSYTITNNGTGPLNLGWFHITSDPAGDIEVLQHPDPNVAPGGSTVLQIRVLLSGPAATAGVSGWSDDGQLSWTIEAATVAGMGNTWAIF